MFYLDHCRHINGCDSFIILLPGLKSGRFIKCLNRPVLWLQANTSNSVAEAWFCSCCSTAMMFHSRMCHVAAQVVNGLCIIYSCIYLYDRDVELIRNASQFDLTAWSMSFCRMKRLRLLQLPSRRCWSSRRLGPVEVGPTYRHVKSLQGSSVKRMSMMFIKHHQCQTFKQCFSWCMLLVVTVMIV